uniref:Uncharacterized protein n=1 Tax=Triticum urartu TaxID=4572 RepID=A0A8R7TI52_TRIUA
MAASSSTSCAGASPSFPVMIRSFTVVFCFAYVRRIEKGGLVCSSPPSSSPPQSSTPSSIRASPVHPPPARSRLKNHNPETGADATEYDYIPDEPFFPKQPGVRGSRG